MEKNNTISVLFFGALVPLVGLEKIELSDICDTEVLLLLLKKKYPELKTRTFRIAVNKKFISDKTALTKNDEVALLPPFSGG